MTAHPYERWHSTLYPFLVSKMEELQLLGYPEATTAEVWSYLLHKKWKKPKEDVFLHQLVQDVMSVSVSGYMTFLTVEAYKAPAFDLKGLT
ncbi:post-transcriptional regulator [Aureibacillus halotolerans]|uniref:ComN-like post-transcriptional regulator n=1 Tax=Aureibacillus halotolerans TaxID=1508390 RepID=A0A4R6TVY6_9BACI|nr:post-transcriptional regulator [Aureibacillus halotolerans]TDQ37988.1 ComN-like post-transcriptional regulator [Aureibacillus halotolerans]